MKIEYQVKAINMSKDILKQVEIYMEQEDLNFSQLVRRAINEFLEKK